MQIEEYDAVILDMNLPDGNALQVLSELRLRTELPAIVISGGGGPELRADTLDMGADDYLMKPFSLRELQARVTRAVNRMQKQNAVSNISAFDGFQFDRALKIIKLPNREYSLTDMEARLLSQLLSNTGRVCSRQHLSEAVCFREFRSEDRTIDIYIGRLRTVFSEFRQDEVIETVRGIGYRFLLKPMN